ncbi:heavy-metal-associated domain-containing protein [Serratia oryzae]|uniref:HMA domain-containing protein n=1 Tax=Serratia oryzae TaxID=2034155 RepID=A0A1S8CLX2_9GAMM|nr:heavy-metal-associated domain-containing protein [Serratia oryzae]OMQ24497.1 hypothetical protein BMI79_06595 [Serratia oryzae]VXC89104.1 conserved hypothetical protein [Enterobacterales bacterium 8AC]
MNSIQLRIPTMKCGGCAASITKAVKALDSAARIDADPATKRVNIESSADGAVIIAALATAGFPSSVEQG